MKKYTSVVAATMSFVFASSHAQSGPSESLSPTAMIPMPVARPANPIMTHELATLIQSSHKAQAQYRRSGSAEDLARVKALQTELAQRGIGRAPHDMKKGFVRIENSTP